MSSAVNSSENVTKVISTESLFGVPTTVNVANSEEITYNQDISTTKPGIKINSAVNSTETLTVAAEERTTVYITEVPSTFVFETNSTVNSTAVSTESSEVDLNMNLTEIFSMLSSLNSTISNGIATTVLESNAIAGTKDENIQITPINNLDMDDGNSASPIKGTVSKARRHVR